jgi:hypothetical protein
LPAEATKAFAAQQPNVEVVASDEFNAIDRAAATHPPAPAPTHPAETVGAASSAGPIVQAVGAEQFNDTDRRTVDAPQRPATDVAADAQTHRETAVGLWVHWVWSALGGAFVALAAIARYFFS